MSDTATRLIKTLLSAQTLTNIVGRRIAQSRVPEGTEPAYVWINRRGVEDDGCLAPGVGTDHAEQYFDVECWGDLGASQNVAAAVRGAIKDYYGTFDDSTVAGIFVTDHDDSYAPLGGDGEATFCAALAVQISYA